MAEAENATQEQSDLDAVNAHIKTQVETYFNELNNRVSPSPSPSPQSDANSQLKDLISPFIEPGLNQARFEGADAKDYVRFYTGNQDAVEYQDEVEKTFKVLADAGRATSRADILFYLQGKEYRTDREKFIERDSVKQKGKSVV